MIRSCKPPEDNARNYRKDIPSRILRRTSPSNPPVILPYLNTTSGLANATNPRLSYNYTVKPGNHTKHISRYTCTATKIPISLQDRRLPREQELSKTSKHCSRYCIQFQYFCSAAFEKTYAGGIRLGAATAAMYRDKADKKSIMISL